MTMHIVVGVDESDGAAEALRWAVREADARDAVLTAVLVWGWLDQHHLDPGEPFDPKYHEADALTALERMVAKAPARRGPARHPAQGDQRPRRPRAGPGGRGRRPPRRRRPWPRRLQGPAGRLGQPALPAPRPVPGRGRQTRTTRRREIRRIVVGIDGSTTSRRALDWALDAARAHRARVEVVHAWHPSYVTRWTPTSISSADVLEQSRPQGPRRGDRSSRRPRSGRPDRGDCSCSAPPAGPSLTRPRAPI